MARTSQVHHCPFWHVRVTGRFHPVHEAVPELQPDADHRRPQSKPYAPGQPSEGQHPGEKIRRIKTREDDFYYFLFFILPSLLI